VRVAVAHEDITERKQAGEELQRKTALLEAQLNSSIEGILVVDKQARKLLQNQPQHGLDRELRPEIGAIIVLRLCWPGTAAPGWSM